MLEGTSSWGVIRNTAARRAMTSAIICLLIVSLDQATVAHLLGRQ